MFKNLNKYCNMTTEEKNYFKVVSTVENDGTYYTAVPNKWENCGILFWPEKLSSFKREALRSKSSCDVDTSWNRYTCSVKFSNIRTFEEALKLEKVLAACTDSESEEMKLMNYGKRSTKNYRASTYCTDRNKLMEETINSDVIYFDYEDKDVIESSVKNNNLILDNNKVQLNFSTSEPVLDNQITIQNCNNNNNINENENQNYVLLNSTFGPENQNLQNEIDSIKEEIKFIKEEQIKTNTYLDRIYKILTHSNKENKTQSDQKQVEFDKMFPLKTCEDIRVFNTKIENNEDFKINLIHELSRFGGTGGKQIGSKIGYQIADYVFSKDVLLNYSWTGISKTKDISVKLAFSMLDGVIFVFNEVIFKADDHWTRKNTENLFKEGILKHAKKRNARQVDKTSKSNKQKSDENSLPIEDKQDTIILSNTDVDNTHEHNNISKAD